MDYKSKVLMRKEELNEERAAKELAKEMQAAATKAAAQPIIDMLDQCADMKLVDNNQNLFKLSDLVEMTELTDIRYLVVFKSINYYPSTAWEYNAVRGCASYCNYENMDGAAIGEEALLDEITSFIARNVHQDELKLLTCNT